MLFLNKNEIKTAVTMEEVIDAIDYSYKIYETKQYQMPFRTQIMEGENTFLLMPCYTNESIATKLVTVFPNNIKEPTLNGLMILNCNKTGRITALLDGTYLTGFRTGAVGGSAIRHLSNENAKSIAIIGTGSQGLYQAIAACAVRPITDIYVYNRTKEKVPSFIKALSKWTDTNIHIHNCSSVENAIKNAEIIITSTTSSKPVLPEKSSYYKNKLIIGVGSFQPTMREFPKALYDTADQIIVDTEHAIDESGDITVPLKQRWVNEHSIQTMSSLITNKTKEISPRQDKSIVFKTVGMALFDTVVANLIYHNAKEKGIGLHLVT